MILFQILYKAISGKTFESSDYGRNAHDALKNARSGGMTIIPKQNKAISARRVLHNKDGKPFLSKRVIKLDED